MWSYTVWGFRWTAGFVPTSFASALTSSPEAKRANEDATLLGRLGTPEASLAQPGGALRDCMHGRPDVLLRLSSGSAVWNTTHVLIESA